MTVNPREVGQIARAATDKTKKELQLPERQPGTVLEYWQGQDATAPRAKIKFDDATADHSLEVPVAAAAGGLAPGDRVWVQFEPPQGISVTGKIDEPGGESQWVTGPFIGINVTGQDTTPHIFLDDAQIIEAFVGFNLPIANPYIVEILQNGSVIGTVTVEAGEINSPVVELNSAAARLDRLTARLADDGGGGTGHGDMLIRVSRCGGSMIWPVDNNVPVDDLYFGGSFPEFKFNISGTDTLSAADGCLVNDPPGSIVSSFTGPVQVSGLGEPAWSGTIFPDGSIQLLRPGSTGGFANGTWQFTYTTQFGTATVNVIVGGE